MILSVAWAKGAHFHHFWHGQPGPTATLGPTMPMKAWIIKFINRLQTSLWFIPALMALVSALLAVATLSLDDYFAHHQGALPWLRGITYSGEPAGARTILGAIAGSMITVAGTVFSITVVALSLAGSQFGPRLLRNFLSDRGNQAVLGTFVATFIYCILVMRSVLGETSEANAFVPVLSVSVALGLGVASLGVLIYFVHHIAQSMQAGQIISSVYLELEARFDELFPQNVDSVSANSEEAMALENAIDERGTPIVSPCAGYVQGIDIRTLARLGDQYDIIMRVALGPGDFVVPGGSLAHVVTKPDEPLSDDAWQEILDAFPLDEHRSPHQNVEFSIDQIVEVAVRALSPGINDPFTACDCLDRLGAILSLLAGKQLPSPYCAGANGRLRLILPPASYPRLVHRAFHQICRNCRTIPVVTRCVIRIVGQVAEVEHNPTRRRALLAQLDVIEQQLPDLPLILDQHSLQTQLTLTRQMLKDENHTRMEIIEHRRLLSEHRADQQP